MRGLPPVPSTVARLTQEWEIGGGPSSTSWWLLLNLPVGYGVVELASILSDYTLFALPNLLGSMTENISPTTCRLAIDGLEVVQHNPPAHGAFGGSLALNTASGIIWRTGDPGRQGWTITYLPGCPQNFLELGWQLSAEGYNNILDSAINFKLQLENPPSFPAGSVVLGSLLRKLHGAPRATSVFRPIINVAPAPKIVTIRRRIPNRSSVLPF